MPSIRIKNYTKLNGTVIKKYELTYCDQFQKRHSRLFKTKREADDERIRIENEVSDRSHIPSRGSKTVIEGLWAWHSYMEGLVKAGKRERGTVAKYKSHIEYHIAKADLATIAFSHLAPADIQNFVEYLETNLSTVMAQKVFQTLKTGFKYCRKKQMLRYIPTEDFSIEKRDREKSGKVEIPSKADIRSLLKAADNDITGINGAIVRILCFCGLRPSEMRGLRRNSIFLDDKLPYLEVTQRADVYGKIGNPKSRAGYRKIPLGPDTVNFLRKAMLSRKAGNYNLVLPNSEGGVMNYYNFVHRRWPTLMRLADLAKTEVISYKGMPEKKVKKIIPQFSPYALRHVAASQWIEMGVQPKRLQELMGHSSIQMTMDIYGHLWANPEADKHIALGTELAFA